MSDEKSRTKIGNRLQSYRERLNLTQEEVAEHLDIPRSAVSLIESGDRGLDYTELLEYAKIFKTHVDKLVEETKVAASSRMSENRTPAAPYLSTASVEEELLAMGMEPSEFSFDLTPVGQSGKISRACVDFHMPLHHPELRTMMAGWLEELNHQAPASQTELILDHNGRQGAHQLRFLVATP